MERKKLFNGEKQTTTIIIIIAQLLVRECRRAVVSHREVFVLREHRNLRN